MVFGQSRIHLEALYQACLEHTRPVIAPLALISQIQRSGGTLLSQLFDGHSELHAHPHELKIGYPTKYTWPKLDLKDASNRWLETLFETSVLSHFKKGYKKEKKRDDAFLFLFLPSLQRELFLDYVGSIDPLTLRDVFDGYMTSYFGAWLNNQNSYGQKRFITAFTARLAMRNENMQSFFEIYPDGRLISIIRDPKNWYPSAIRHKPKICRGIRDGLDLWKKNARAMLRNKDRYGDRVCILTFEDLITRTKSVMRYLAEFLEIEFEDILLEPTFNKYPIRANTSFEAEKNGIIKSTLERYKTLTQEELEFIQSKSEELYGQVLSLAIQFD
ncbi:MAG: sulfotransferase [Syntrophobacterales bacterium]